MQRRFALPFPFPFAFAVPFTAVLALLGACTTTTTVVNHSSAEGGAGGGDGGGGGGEGGGASSVTLDEACASQSAAICALMKQCYATGFNVDYASDADCQKKLSVGCMFYSSVPDSNITPDDIAACASAYTGGACDAYFSGSLCPTIGGKRATGTACQYGAQCTSGYCGIAAAGTCGICVDPVAEGAACSTTKPCKIGSGTYCGPKATCVKYAAAGQSCGSMLPNCGSGLQCINGKCGKGASLGQTCDNNMTPCDFYSSLTCDTTQMKCIMQPFAQTGQTCGGDPTVLCVAGTCKQNGQSQSCVADLGEGAACTTGMTPVCGYPYQCGSNGKCTLPEDLGCN